MTNIQDQLVDKIKELMNEQSLNANKLAQASDLTEATISRVLAKKVNPNLETMARLATGFGIEIRDLFEFQDRGKIPARTRKLMEGQNQEFFDIVNRIAVLARGA